MPPRFQKGSLPDQCSDMKRGDVVLVPDNGAPAAQQQQNLDTMIRRLESRVPGEWQVQTCYGLKASDLLAPPFRFYRIERIV